MGGAASRPCRHGRPAACAPSAAAAVVAPAPAAGARRLGGGGTRFLPPSAPRPLWLRRSRPGYTRKAVCPSLISPPPHSGLLVPAHPPPFFFLPHHPPPFFFVPPCIHAHARPPLPRSPPPWTWRPRGWFLFLSFCARPRHAAGLPASSSPSRLFLPPRTTGGRAGACQPRPHGGSGDDAPERGRGPIFRPSPPRSPPHRYRCPPAATERGGVGARRPELGDA